MFRDFPGEEAHRELLAGLPYGESIEASARRHEVDALLLAAVVQVESSFRSHVVSPMGAVGLTQVLPSTARYMGVDGDLSDPDRNLEAGARYLAYLIDEFDGDLSLALAAYNAGPGAVRRYDGVPPYRETRNYVRKVMRLYAGHHRQAWFDSGAVEQVGLLGEQPSEDALSPESSLAVEADDPELAQG